MSEIKLKGPEKPAISGKKPKQLIVFLHGVGANGEDLISIASEIADEFPDAYFASPNAPFACDMMPPGYSGSYQWFSLQDRNPANMLAGAKIAGPILNRYLDEKLKELNLKDEDMALVGFSQGTMMALFCGLRRENRIAGILGYSGAMIHAPALDAEIISKPPVTLIHGTADNVVPLEAMYYAKSELARLGIKPETYERPGLMHSIDMEGIGIGIGFLKKSLKIA